MTIPVKIQCGCGQRYAFDVEPVNGRVGHAVACPVCGADGTTAANAVIAQSMPPQAVSPERAMPMRVAVATVGSQSALSAPASTRGALAPGQLEPEKALAEALSKINWGDPAEKVVGFLTMHAFSRDEASTAVQAMVQRRKSTLRGIGLQKIVTGTGLMAVPLVVYLIMAHFGVISLKLLSFAVVVGLWGAYMVFKGLMLILIPKAEKGDIADQ